MKLAIIGSGYVGLVTATCLAKQGHDVICVDIDEKRVEMINKKESPIFEPRLKEYLEESNLKATVDLDYAMENSDVCFVCVPTPSNEDGSVNLDYVKNVSIAIGERLANKGYYTIVVKSTIVPGTSDETIIPILERESGKKAGEDFGVCMNPEFLREGHAIHDFENPNRIVIGEHDKRSGDILAELYSVYNCPIIRTSTKTAELSKYASNALLATKITFANEIGNLCKKLGIDVYDVMKIVGMDNRVSEKFLNAGIGFGGSCFPKDVAALVARSKELGHEAKVLSQVINSNKEQRMKIVELLENKIGSLEGKKIAILGLSFKPDTDDIRDAPSVDIIKKLQEKGAKISAYDPKAMDNVKKIFNEIDYAQNAQNALEEADACLILTEWNEFKDLKDNDFNSMKNRIIIEGRKVLNPENVKDFEGICW
ncbi:MAG: UDP-glucose/GDP-mannose dehydrogenase family protein [Nanoarchaeota archaeon]|nr:UDP-glucose/GDP-mannose dehydrogenase family protein [Nanoarchaeota archaeon]